jgi:hypothetical protein
MKISKEKRQHLILVGMLTAGAVVGLYLGLVRPQQQSVKALGDTSRHAASTLQQMKETIQGAERVETQLAEANRKLGKMEEGMATGDLYSWAITAIRQFKLPYKVDVPQYSQIDGPRDVALLPQFPYKQVTITIGGAAYFHDFGKFVADFENQYPYMRVQNLTLEPISGLVTADREKLSFKLDIVMLVKPTTT